MQCVAMQLYDQREYNNKNEVLIILLLVHIGIIEIITDQEELIMKKFIAFAVIGLMLTGCGSDDSKDMDYTYTTEETTAEETSNFDFSEDESIFEAENKDREKTTAEDSEKSEEKTENEKTDVSENPEVAQASPVNNVSNELFVEVSAAVRNNCRSDSKANAQQLMSNWSSKVKTNEEKVYANTASNLINSYARLNKCRNMIYENSNMASDDDIVLLTSIEDGLSANVEIFLNTDTTSVMDSNFAYGAELDKLELSLNNK